MLESLLLSAMSAFIPVAIDGAKGLFNRIAGGAQAEPANFAELLQMQKLEIEKLQAIASLDAPAGQVSLWVSNLRASMRYLSAALILGVWALVAIISIWVPVADEIVQWIGTMASSVMFFLFGDRVYMNLKFRGMH